MQNIRNKRGSKSLTFYQLQGFVEYKAMLQGVPVIDIDPQLLRNVVSVDLYAKEMTRDLCPSVHDHVDVNGSFGIRKSILYCSLDRFDVDRDTPKGSTDIPKEATLTSTETLKPLIP